MEPQAALVGADSAVELHAVTVVNLSLALIVHPSDPELDSPVRSSHPLQDGVAAVSLFITVDDRTQRLQNLFHGLVEFGLGRVLLLHALQDLVNIVHR